MTRARSVWGSSIERIRAAHTDRVAIVYVRQSSRQQVLEHTESTRLQYGLVERAVALGWPRSRVTVIDDDLGVSAAVADARVGFQKLVTEVTMGRVGLVVGFEMSRLARTGRDWHQLLELCTLSDTLLADPDGVYDPSYYNDRLLLGLKGTMSEAELYLIRQRMASGRLAKAERGELAVQLPIGYVRRPSGEVVLEPDEQARSVVMAVFDAFDRLGTLNAVLRYLVENRIQLPVRARSGQAKGELEWRRPNRETLQIMLHNPIYAGYYAYGRRQVEARRKRPGRPSTGRVVRDPQDYYVLLPDRMPAYISVQRYEANIARLAANRQVAGAPGAPRDGAGLLSGILCCGICGGHRMTVQYHDQARATHSYTCAFTQTNYGIGGSCQHISGLSLDRYVTDQVLHALTPAVLEVCLAALGQAEAERAELDRIWRQRLERAEYAAQRARRQYQLAEPENRLVTRQLERDWEAALADKAELEAEYQRFRETRPLTLTGDERRRILELAEDLPALWHAPSTTMADRKALLRILIEKITVAVVGESEQVHVEITWAGGHRSSGIAFRPVARYQQLSYYPKLTARITDLAGEGRSAAQIADELNREGLRPPKRTETFNPSQVRALARNLGLHITHPLRTLPPAHPIPGRWTITSLADELQMPTATVYNWIRRGWITAHRAEHANTYIIDASENDLEQLSRRRALPPGYYTRQAWAKKAAEALRHEGREGAER